MAYSVFNNLPFSLDEVLAAIPPGISVYLVGGAVRDRLLKRQVHDLDFLLSGQVIPVARRVADCLGGSFYPLDKTRDYARVILYSGKSNRYILDFAPIKDGDLEADLRNRDFTLNAIAIDIRHPQKLIDPLGGAAHLQSKLLVPCSSTSLSDDPVRVVRASRLAVNYSLRIPPETNLLLRGAVSALPVVSPERLRDELFRILGNPQPATALRLLDTLGALPFLLPELADLKGLLQPPPHILDAWEHTLDTLTKLESLISVLERDYDPDRAANLMLGLAVLRLGRFRQQVSAHLETTFTPERSLRPLLFLAALYHDVAKPSTRQVEKSGKVRFLQHDQVGAEMAQRRGRALRLSNEEIARLESIVRGHMRPLLLAHSAEQPSRRAIYRFFKDLGPAGIDIGLLSLADTLATYGVTLPQETWSRHLDVVRYLWEAYWEKREEQVAPPLLLNGHDLIKRYRLAPGAQIGELLEALQEAQATGQVSSLEEADALIRGLLDQG